jgi:Baseplate J-like protein
MSLPTPNLDDRNFRQLLDEAKRRLAQVCPDWTDQTPGDPGMVLLELFSYLSEVMIYRLNRLPDKVFIELLRLIGVKLEPPAAAATTLVFSRTNADEPLELRRGTKVAAESAGSNPVIFVTTRTVTIAAGQKSVEVAALNCEIVEGELGGYGSGLANQTLKTKHTPIIAPSGDDLDLIVGVEALPGELEERAPARQYEGKTYRIWREVPNFSNIGNDPFVYIADKITGTIIFAPAARMPMVNGQLSDAQRNLAAVPAPNREIRLWYRYGGGLEGNVGADTLKSLKTQISGVKVTNSRPAVGGREAESLENALIRGPQLLHSLQRAVTARDYELVALYSSRAVARAKAITKAAAWLYATPGTVEVILVPFLPQNEQASGRVTANALKQRETDEARAQIQTALDQRRPLGTICQVKWANYKKVSATLKVVVRPEEDPSTIKQRVLERLHQTICPLPTRYNSTGWQFGQALRSSHIYDIALAEPGVRWVDNVRLVVDDVPEKNVSALINDKFQPNTWYAASTNSLYRTLDNGDGWEPVARFPGEQLELIRVHPDIPGLLVVSGRVDGGSRLHISYDCGETWDSHVNNFAFHIEDIAGTLRDNTPLLLLASDKGLYELALKTGSNPVQVLVDAADQDRGFYAVAVAKDIRGTISVVVGATDNKGVYLSSRGGQGGTFQQTGLVGEDIREFNVQEDGTRQYLWAGAFSAGGDDPGKGCFRWELRGTEPSPDGWQSFNKGWSGGSCRGITFSGGLVLAATHRAGVVRLDPRANNPTWQALEVRSGLPLRDQGRFHPVTAVAFDVRTKLIMAGGIEGVYSSKDNGNKYDSASAKVFSEKVTLPDTWLFVSGEHDITVVSENEAR